MNEEAEASGPGWERGRVRSSGGADTGLPDRTAADAAGRQARRWGWGRWEEGGPAGGCYVMTCLPVGIAPWGLWL